jgi:YHS domain-containing protein
MTVRRQEMKEPGMKEPRLEMARIAVLIAVSMVGLGGLAAGALVGQAAAATTERLVVDRFTGLALGGVDPVAYFTDAKMRAGRPEFVLQAQGAVRRFQNENNRAFFRANPEIYAPRFGGYDPVDVARGVAVAGNPRLWLIHGQRLYLFAREENQAAFAANPEKVLQTATDIWPDVWEKLAQ